MEKQAPVPWYTRPVYRLYVGKMKEGLKERQRQLEPLFHAGHPVSVPDESIRSTRSS